MTKKVFFWCQNFWRQFKPQKKFLWYSSKSQESFTIFCPSVSLHEVVEKVKQSLEEIETSIMAFKEKQKDAYVKIIAGPYF